MRSEFVLAAGLLAFTALSACGPDKTIVRRETVRTTVPTQVERRTTVETLQPEVPAHDTMHHSGSVERRSRTIETIE